MSDDRTEQLKRIRDEVVNLTQSSLYDYRIKNNYHAVLGEGSHNAEVMFVGEAPGLNEAKQGRPFCGAAGRVLDELFTAIGMKRESVYVTNIIKDRPPDNRDPLPQEIALYAPFLLQQIAVIQPKLIVTLGRISMDFIFREFGLGDKLKPISKMHGQAFEAKAPYGKAILVALYHPALGTYNPKTIETMKKDFQIIKGLLDGSPEAAVVTESTQAKLF